MVVADDTRSSRQRVKVGVVFGKVNSPTHMQDYYVALNKTVRSFFALSSFGHHFGLHFFQNVFYFKHV